jgi:hypothetical protein
VASKSEQVASKKCRKKSRKLSGVYKNGLLGYCFGFCGGMMCCITNKYIFLKTNEK